MSVNYLRVLSALLWYMSERDRKEQKPARTTPHVINRAEASSKPKRVVGLSPTMRVPLVQAAVETNIEGGPPKLLQQDGSGSGCRARRRLR